MVHLLVPHLATKPHLGKLAPISAILTGPGSLDPEVRSLII